MRPSMDLLQAWISRRRRRTDLEAMSPGTSCAADASRPFATAGKTRTTQFSATPRVNTRNGFRRRSATPVAGKSCPRRIVLVRCQSIPRQVPGCVRGLPGRTPGWCEVALNSENALPWLLLRAVSAATPTRGGRVPARRDGIGTRLASRRAGTRPPRMSQRSPREVYTRARQKA